MNARPATPYRRLLGVTLAVLVAHLALLGATPTWQAPAAEARPAAQRALPLLTRSIDAPAATPPAATPAPASLAPAQSLAPTPAPAPAPTAAARRAQPPQAAPTRASVLLAEATPAPATPPGATPRAAARAGAPALRTRIPSSARVSYSVSSETRGIPLSASATLNWRQDGQSYSASMEISHLLGSRVQTSRGQLGPDGLEPERFSDKIRSEQATHFERDKGVITFSSNAPSAALAAGTQDRLSVLLQLGALIAGDPARHPVGSTLAVPTAGVRDVDTWAFTVEGSETLRLPGGELDTLRLTRQPRQEHDQRVELWLAPSQDYLPVRVRITQANGDFVDQRWRATDRP